MPTRVLSLGGWVAGGSGQVILNDVYRKSDQVGGVRWVEDEDGFAGLSTTSVYAVCVGPIRSMQEVHVQVPPDALDSLSPKTAVLTCPAGTRVHGVWARLQGAIQDTTLDDLIPAIGLSTATVKAFEDEDGESDLWFIDAFAMCT